MSIHWICEISESLSDPWVGGKALVWHLAEGICDPGETSRKTLCGRRIKLTSGSWEGRRVTTAAASANYTPEGEPHAGVDCSKCIERNLRHESGPSRDGGERLPVLDLTSAIRPKFDPKEPRGPAEPSDLADRPDTVGAVGLD